MADPGPLLDSPARRRTSLFTVGSKFSLASRADLRRQLTWSNAFRTQPLSAIAHTPETVEDGHTGSAKAGEPNLGRVLSLTDVIMYGVACTVGAGIFVVTGVVARTEAGPAIVVSFLLAAFSSLLSGFCYAEFAARFPVSGSAYTFSYVALGELVGWIIGWELTLEYALSASAIARGWAGYLTVFLEVVGADVPPALAAYDLHGFLSLSPLAALLVVGCTLLLLMGLRESTRFTKAVTVINLSLMVFIIVIGAMYLDTSNWTPFAPFGFDGIVTGAGTVFFSYIGFDSVSTLAAECRRPARDLPLGIFGTVTIATTVYIALSLVVTGLQKYSEMNLDAPLSAAFEAAGLDWVAGVVAFCSLSTLTATTLVSLIGQPRIFFQMAKDGLMFSRFKQLSAKQVPLFGTVLTGAFSATLALLFDLGTLADMISIGTLMAFTMVCGGVLLLRYREQSDDALSSQDVCYVQCLEPLGRPLVASSTRIW
eukprot:TRINITY_DN5825_c0_g2_i2.p1 TRINITY_DN5825_c0_g2~~TRINITY_DN5825_c0_g2_i2.p1  ORF type:complete len:482 (-),score=176.59 TRINITY_DN5825_c0_g2_i2:159-1604(-)